MKQFLLILSVVSILMVGCSSGTEKTVKESQQKGDQQYDELLKNLEQKTKPSAKDNKNTKKEEATTQKSN